MVIKELSNQVYAGKQFALADALKRDLEFVRKLWEEGKAKLNELVNSDLKGISEVAAIRLVRVYIELKE